MSKTACKLPNKLSDLLDLAVDDCQKVFRRKGMKENMQEWVYVPRGSEECQACMAGALLLGTCKITKPQPGEQVYGPPELHKYMSAVNSMRVGNFKIAYRAINELSYDRTIAGDIEAVLYKATVAVNYGDYLGRAPWKSYRKAAKILREAGL